MSSSIVLADVGFTWPDGSVALTRISGAFTPGKTGLIGDNGAGKSTLLRLVAAELEPTAGKIETNGDVGYLPQLLTLATETTIAELLGIGEQLTALHAIAAGEADERHFETLGDNWDIESRADLALQRIGFRSTDLDRSVRELSGGETMLIAITGLWLRRLPITLLDEPANNLDIAARQLLAQLLTTWPGTVIVVSHDVELLELMDHTAELRDGELEVFGGPYSAWRQYLDDEQAAAQQSAITAAQRLKVERRQRITAETVLAHRARVGRKAEVEKRVPKIVGHQRKTNAQVSAAKMRAGHDDRVRAAQDALDAAQARVRDDDHVTVDLPDPDVSSTRRIAEIEGGTRTFVIAGPERLAITGPNGSGKTTLVENLISGRGGGHLLTDRVGYLPQRLDGLAEDEGALANVAATAPHMPAGEIRNRLARFLIRGENVYRPVRTLSGGERFRVALAKLLLADPPAQLLILDEPTNNLDLRTVDQLVSALSGYRGALLVISHDGHFLRRIGLDRVLELDRGGLREGELPQPMHLSDSS